MSVSQLARASRIDSKANDITRRAKNLQLQMNNLFTEVLDFAAFMHTDPQSEFTQADRDKYSDDFVNCLNAINSTMARITILAAIESGAVTVQEFLDQYTGDVEVYSNNFSKIS